MDIKLHKLARTTPATRRYIQTAPKTTLARATRGGLNHGSINGSAPAGSTYGSHVPPAPCQYLEALIAIAYPTVVPRRHHEPL